MDGNKGKHIVFDHIELMMESGKIKIYWLYEYFEAMGLYTEAFLYSCVAI